MWNRIYQLESEKFDFMEHMKHQKYEVFHTVLVDLFHDYFIFSPLPQDSLCLPPADHCASEQDPTCSEVVSIYFN